MDSLTHVVLGGCVGEALGGKRLGKKALLLGAAAQSLPDIDFIASFWLSPANDLLAHRGFTHSFLFVLLMAPILALAAERLWPNRMEFRRWISFFGLQIFIHLFLDAFNAYGVAWFEPFSHVRISFHALFVADPFLSIPVATGFALLALISIESMRRLLIAQWSIAWCVVYLSYGLVNKRIVDADVKASFSNQQMKVTSHFSTPTPLNTWLWYIVANTESGSYVGYRSVFDQSGFVAYEFFPRNDSLLSPLADDEDLQQLKRFSEGFYTAEMWSDTLVFNDLRFGQMLGWSNRRGKFVFHYYLNHPESNDLLVQRGRFSGWTRQEALSFIDRIRGQKN